MIRKIFLYMFSLLIICLGIVNFSYGADGYVRQVGLMGYSPNNSGVNLAVLNKGSFLSQYLGVAKDVFFIDNGVYFARMQHPVMGTKSLYLRGPCTQGFASSYYNCDEVIDDGENILQSNPKNCHKVNIVTGTVEILESFLSSVNSSDNLWFYGGGCCGQWCGSSMGLCISSSQYHQSICFGGCTAGSAGYVCSFMSDSAVDAGWALNNSLNLPEDYASIDRYLLLTSPGVNNNFNPGTGSTISDGTTKYLNADIDDYISYYEERFGWNENMCYVGTTDYETLYGSGKICNDLECPETVNFEYGTGGTIFDLYYSLYSGFGNNIVKNVGTFINVRLINYTEQFKLNCNGTGDNIVCQSSGPDYLAKYNGPDTNISLYYEGLTPPFLNNPVAIYFMASNLYNRFSTESTQGEEMAYYCDMKLNYDSYKDGTFNFEELKDKVTPGINQRVKDYKDKEFGNGGGYSIPDFSGTNIRGNLNLTGDGIPDDLSPTKLFKQFYDRMNALLGNFNPNNSVGIIPLWILYPMLFLILFRIIKH